MTLPWKPPVETAKTTMEVGLWHPWAPEDGRWRGVWGIASLTGYQLFIRGLQGKKKNQTCGLRHECTLLVVSL